MTRNIRLVSIRQMKFSFVFFTVEVLAVVTISTLHILSITTAYYHTTDACQFHRKRCYSKREETDCPWAITVGNILFVVFIMYR
mmetsp:Transcript_27103/g.22372  ORF Transcript_27103/g.22372 Transcript_27103/m.22372 type:complete len:84 (-) Transcript_27103:1-252(-)